MSFKFLINKSLLFICLILFLSGCKQSIPLQEFIEQVNKDEDFVKEVESSSFKVTCTYKPKELLALAELRGKLNENKFIDKSLYDSTLKIFSNSSYFTLQIGLQDGSDILQKGISGRQDYALRVNELTYNMNRDFYMLTEHNDTIRTTLFDFQRSYGMSPIVTILYVFPFDAIKENKKIKLVYTDRLFGIQSPVIFEFDSDKLRKSLPKVKEIKSI